MATMRFPTRIAQATDDQQSARYALRGTLVTPEGFAVATDGHLAACVKAQVEGLAEPTMVPQELGPKSKTDLKAEYHANGQLTCEKHSIVKGQRRVEEADIKDGRFPRVGDVLDGLNADKTLVLAINADYLRRLAQAINVPDTPSADVVILLVPQPQKDGVVTEAVGVLSNHDSRQEAGGFGILMPCDTDAKESRADFDKLRRATQASLDTAAQSWSDMCVARWKKEEAKAAAKKAAEEPKQDASAAEESTQPKPRRKAKRSVA